MSEWGKYQPLAHGRKKKKARYKRVFIHLLELLAVALSYLQSSRIARFLSTKVALDLVVEITARFGSAAGHRLSTILAIIVAEPRIIVAVTAAAIAIIELTVWICRRLTGRITRPDQDG